MVMYDYTSVSGSSSNYRVPRPRSSSRSYTNYYYQQHAPHYHHPHSGASSTILGWRPRLCLLGFLLSLYLVAFVLISLANLDGERGWRPSSAKSYDRSKGDNGYHQGMGSGAHTNSGSTNSRAYGSSAKQPDVHSNFAGKLPGGNGFRTAMGARGRRPPPSRLKWCVEQHFREDAGPVVALASFPGSGNTWLRYLLQQATGIHTGSVYKDYALLKHGFPAESIVNGFVLCVKTHEWGPAARQMFNKAILVVRDPSAAILAEFNRQSGGHVGHAGLDKYKRNHGKYWSDFVQRNVEAWKTMIFDWLLNFSGPVHVVFYEDLTANVADELRGVLQFLQANVSNSTFECVMKNKDGIYKRKKRNMTFDPFSPAMKQLLASEKKLVYAAIQSFREHQLQLSNQTHKHLSGMSSAVTTVTTGLQTSNHSATTVN